ncbi:MAG TPA: DnaJ domain-containing protein [Rhodopila sp.]
MLPPPTSLDPKGYYARLGLQPVAAQAAVVAAFRARARILHPDVADTGDAVAFVAVREAYDVLSDPERREDYDRSARQGVAAIVEPEVTGRRPAFDRAAAAVVRPLHLSRSAVLVVTGLTAFLGLCLYEVASHLLAKPAVVSAGIRPNAATVEPLSPDAHRAVLYGPAPVRLAGKPNFYVVPASSPTFLWHHDPTRNVLVPLGQLPAFSSVQAIRLVRQNGMLEVLISDGANGFIAADHLTPGDPDAARSAYCGYNAGPTPRDGEVLERRGSGGATLTVENRAVQPAVVKLRDTAGAVAVAVFLGPAGHASLAGLPEGLYRPEFAVGELWSRACNVFAAGMRARRMDTAIRLPGDPQIVVAPDGEEPGASEISDQTFQQE